MSPGAGQAQNASLDGLHGFVYALGMPEPPQPDRTGHPQSEWGADDVQSLRRHLGLTQRGLAEELGVRQQTVSEWETGLYRPRGASRRLLGRVAERADFAYAGGKMEQHEDPKTPSRPADEAH